MGNPQQIAETFFAAYARALLDRDSDAIAELYAVPALVAFPRQSIPVGDREQTRQFFDRGWAQYEGVDEVTPTVTVVIAGAHSIWADVVWSYGGQRRERFVYQLLEDAHVWRVGVLTPLDLDA